MGENLAFPFRKLDFEVSGQTEFLRRKRPVSFKDVRSGDLVEIRFRSAKHGWEAYRVKISAKKTKCETR